MMVGRDVNLVVPKKKANPTEPVLEVKDIYVEDERGQTTVRGVSFEVAAGAFPGHSPAIQRPSSWTVISCGRAAGDSRPLQITSSRSLIS